ncbi:hypothetical protein NN561_014910 [Cricetulus griseus]
MLQYLSPAQRAEIGEPDEPVVWGNGGGEAAWFGKRRCRIRCKVERTERIKNSLSPKFSKTFIIDYYFEVVQKLKFGIYDIDNKTIELSDDDFLGEFEVTLGQISAEEIKDNRVVLFEMEARKLDNKDLFGKSDPYLEFHKQTSDGNWLMVHRTEVGVDFTGSNGDPSSSDSLHYISPNGVNEYLTAIWSVGLVIQDYDAWLTRPWSSTWPLVVTGATDNSDPDMVLIDNPDLDDTMAFRHPHGHRFLMNFQ